MAGNEPVTSPDQRKPGSRKGARIGAVITILSLVALTQGNHEGNIEEIWLLGIAVLIAIILIGDWLLRKNGLRS